MYFTMYIILTRYIRVSTDINMLFLWSDNDPRVNNVVFLLPIKHATQNNRCKWNRLFPFSPPNPLTNPTIPYPSFITLHKPFQESI